MSNSSRKTKGSSDQMWNTLTTATLGLAVLVTIYYMVVLVSPSLSPFGPKEDPTPVAMISMPTPGPTGTATATIEAAAPTWTQEPTSTEAPTATPRPPRATRTPRPTVYFTPIPTITGTPTPTRHPYPFKLSDEGVVFQRYPFSSECNWLGIAGEVVDQEGEPVIGLPVVLNGGGLQNVVTTSGDRADYAPSGWEHFLDSQVKEGSFTVQLYRVVGNESFAVSELVEVQTRKDCRANLAYLKFELVWEDYALP